MPGGALFYRGDVLGSSLSTRMVEFCGRSGVVMDLLQDLTEGTQSYATLLTRLYGGLAASLFEIAANSVRGVLPHLRSAES